LIASVRRLRQLLTLAWVSACACLTPRNAEADKGRILLVTVPEQSGGWPKAEKRAEAELHALGLEVRVTSQPALGGCTDDSATRAALDRAGALGAVELRLLPGPKPALRVCVVELVTGKAASRHIDVTASLQPGQAALLAVELVHASLLEVRARHPSRGQVAASPAVEKTVDRQLVRPSAPWLGVRVGAAVFASPGGVSPSLAPDLGIGLRPTRRLVLDGDGAFSVLPGLAERDEGSASVGLSVARVHGVYSLVDARRLVLGLGLGVGFVAARVTGAATPPFRSTNGVGTTWFGSTTLGVSYALSPEWWLRLDGHLAWSPEPIRVDFADASHVQLGRPLVDGGLSLEWRLLH